MNTPSRSPHNPQPSFSNHAPGTPESTLHHASGIPESPLHRALAAHRPLILDGAMGTMIQSYGLREEDFRGTGESCAQSFADLPGQQAGNNDLLCLTRPDVIADIHKRYLAAGADIITTNTFNAQRISLADYHCEHLVRAINLAAVRIARSAIASSIDASVPGGSPSGAPRFVVGSVGPTNKSLSMSPDINDPALRAVTFDELADAYVEQMTALIEGGVDALLIETIFDTLNAKAAIYAADEAMRRAGRAVPLMLSVTVSDRAGRLLSGQTLDAFLASVAHAPLLSIGLNCSFGAEDMLPHLRQLRKAALALPLHHTAAPLPTELPDSLPSADTAAIPSRTRVPIYISAYPNAGLPNQLGQYDETPALMAAHVCPFLEESLVDIIGGCCGTTDAHIRAIAALAAPSPTAPASSPNSPSASSPNSPSASSPRPVAGGSSAGTPASIPASNPASPLPSLTLAGLEPLALTPEVAFINVGERCNVAGSRKFLRLIKEKQYEEALGIARKQVEDGALVLDLNMDDGLLDTRAEMCHFLCLMAAEPDICRVPVMVDSSKWDVIRAALGCIQGKPIVNSISLKEGEDVFLSHARELRRMGAAVIVMAFDEEGQATTFERRCAVCERAYRLLTERIGFPAEDIIFDPNVLAIATGMSEHDRYALDFIRAAAWIKEHLPGAHVSGGVSNLSFSFRGNNYIREAMHAVFLYHARKAGMDMAIVNPATTVTYADIPADQLRILEDAILARTPDACEHLTELAESLAPAPSSPSSTASAPGSPASASSPGSPASSPAPGSPASRPVAGGSSASIPASIPSLDDRLITALRRGTTETLEADLAEALHVYPRAVDIIEGPLMKGMNLVGQLFGEGKMFLPQVVKTARTMKRAVEILQPALQERSQEEQPSTSSEDTPAAPPLHDGRQTPRVLVATVKGDVHDIGKNIVATVMACNGYEVIDLGVMVPAETIVAKALELSPDVIGLSGLITPSLEEMVHTVHLLDEADIHVPVMIGGATTSALHTALKIAPVYHGPVLHVCDASQNAPLAAPFLNPATAADATAQLAAEQAALRQQATAHTTSSPTTLEEARARKPHLF